MEKHSPQKSVILHLLPGILGGVAYFLLVPVVKAHDYPSFMALVLAGILVLIPFELGYLIYQKQLSRKKLIGGIVKYNKHIPLWQYFIWIPLILIFSGLLFSLLDNVSDYLKEIFRWIPERFYLDMGLDENHPKQKLLISYAFFFVFIVVLAPITEELYFRGFLLPRMRSSPAIKAMLVHSILFALYHTWTPWMFLSRAIGVLPLIYIVKKKENIYLGIIAHCILNSLDFVAGLIFISKM